MSFTAPSAPSPPCYIGKGIIDGDSVEIDIFGHSLPNTLSTEVSSHPGPFSIADPTTLFDVSSLTPNHEVPVMVYVSPNDIYDAVTYTYSWYRKRDSKLVFQFNVAIADPGEGLHYNAGSVTASAWIGWLSDDVDLATYPLYREIQENGDYYVNISATGGDTIDQDVDFVIEGIPSSTVLENSTISGFDWTVRISNYFDDSNYIRVGITTDSFTDGQSSEPSGILDYNFAPSSNSGCATEGTISGLSPDTYTVYGFAQAADGNYYQAGFDTITTGFNWDTPKVSGNLATVTASEWNRFADQINDARLSHFLGTFPFSSATSGHNFNKEYFNDAINAISAMSPSVSLPSDVSTGGTFYAYLFNDIRDSFNSV